MTSFPKPERPQPLLRPAFPVFRDIPTRWMDVDIYGHVNNVQYLSFFDTAVNGWYVEQGLLDPRSSPTVFLVVETGCHYFSELIFPETIRAGIRIERIGSSSVVYQIGLFQDGKEKPAAQGRFVHVHVGRETRRPIPIPAEMRDKLNLLIMG
ncbi:acyl-CoA thioesterase [Roseibium litorale]|uniref:Acyl-CoA thioesterase n=1 Tax=Roseibium litorale TaxID=2803841 RepID=A0ABR9CU04_9HYPH|nr:thioesterase family protein [Roseibium litorale]MBD8894322.1 acyl-CoA thioesterase [Roseibium litorale]